MASKVVEQIPHAKNQLPLFENVDRVAMESKLHHISRHLLPIKHEFLAAQDSCDKWQKFGVGTSGP